MIVRNTYTGALHEVPDQQLYEVGEPVYDGFGNPVGGLFDDILKGVGSIVSGPISAVTSLMNPIAGAASNILAQPLQAAAAPIVNAAQGLIPGLAPSAPPAYAPGVVAPPPGTPWAPPWPSGWTQPPIPYTGLAPRRVYMRCSVWPGPPGLVPTTAMNGQLMPGMPGYPGMPAMPGGGGFHHRHHRRHR
jgi:hypothetical protein